MPGFGWSPFGTRPFSVLVDLPLPLSAVAASAAGFVFLVEIYPTSGPPGYVATQQYTTLPTDSLPNVAFNGTVENALRFKRSIIDGSRIGGMSSGYSEITLHNSSGEYDSAAEQLDGARVVVKMVRQDASYDSAIQLYSGIVDGGAHVDEELLRLQLFDDNGLLDIPVQPSVYGGTGGIDGDDNVKGKRKPLGLGVVRNATCVLIDAVNLVYQYHDGPVATWVLDGNVGVFDRAVRLDINSTPDYANYAALIAATITPGRYATCVALGIFRLGAKADGIVTATFVGAISNGLVATAPTVGAALLDTASIAHYLITISGASIVVDFGSVIALKAAQPALIGYFVGPDDNKTLRQAHDDLMFGILGWSGFRRDRTFDMGLVALATGTPLGDYTSLDFYDLKKLQLPKVMSPPPWRVRAAYSLNWTQQPEVDATVDPATTTLRKDRFSIASSTNASLSATIRTAYPHAQDPEVWPSLFLLEADAVAFCNATLDLFGGAVRGLYEITLPADGYALNLSNPIKVTDDRYLLSGGKSLSIMSIDDDTTEEQAIVEALG